MAALAEAVRVQAARSQRLCADPGVGVSQIMGALKAFCAWERSKDIWQLLKPPPDAPQSYSFKSSPNSDWLAKTSGLLYDLILVAPSGKLSSKVLNNAIGKLLEDREIQNNTSLERSDFIDRIDRMVRILLSKLRDVKGSTEVHRRMERRLGQGQQRALRQCLSKLDNDHGRDEPDHRRDERDDDHGGDHDDPDEKLDRTIPPVPQSWSAEAPAQARAGDAAKASTGDISTTTAIVAFSGNAVKVSTGNSSATTSATTSIYVFRQILRQPSSPQPEVRAATSDCVMTAALKYLAPEATMSETKNAGRLARAKAKATTPEAKAKPVNAKAAKAKAKAKPGNAKAAKAKAKAKPGNAKSAKAKAKSTPGGQTSCSRCRYSASGCLSCSETKRAAWQKKIDDEKMDVD